ncbi:MAG: glycosyltransferase family 39 protein, partial [Armatimonadota bacterium]|nr:glycosyltransferase family 39 protein [Armatimonadota bacterium]
MHAVKQKRVLHADSKPTSKNISRQEWLIVAFVLALAAAFRIAYLIQYKAHIPYYFIPIGDSAYYDIWAQRVAKGEGYGQMSFYLAPLYPYVLALIYGVIGHKLVVVYVLQVILGAFNLLLVYMLGRKIFSHWVGVASMVLLLFYAPIAYLESKLLSETIWITLSLLSMLFLLFALEQPSTLIFLAAGFTLGLSAICRPVGLIFIAFVLVWLVFNGYRQVLRVFVPLLMGISIAVLPVTVRNYMVSGEFVPISTNSGMTFWHGNNPDATGICSIPPGLTTSIMDQQREEMAIASKALGRDVTASESSFYWFGRSLNFIRTHPSAYARLLGKKVIWSLHSREAPCNYNVYLERKFVPVLRVLFMPFWVILGFGMLGYVFAHKEGQKKSNLIALYVICVFVS